MRSCVHRARKTMDRHRLNKQENTKPKNQFSKLIGLRFEPRCLRSLGGAYALT